MFQSKVVIQPMAFLAPALVEGGEDGVSPAYIVTEAMNETVFSKIRASPWGSYAMSCCC